MPANTLLDDLKRLGASGGTRKDKGLPSLADLPSIPARVGAALPEADPVSGGGGGLASPVTENVSGGRVYYAERNQTTTDGLIYSKWAPIQQLNMTDDNGAPVVFNFQAPP